MDYMDFTLRIVLALVLGAAIGLERQLTGHSAGIRINVLICMGTCFFTLFPMIYGSGEVFRVGSSIISGVGFLCSGVIFKENGAVRGMNTAATLWCTSAIGILSSTGKPLIAVISTCVLIISNLILRPAAGLIYPAVRNEENEKTYRMSVMCTEDSEAAVRKLLISGNRRKGLYINYLRSEDLAGDRVEVVAEYSSAGKAKDHLMEDIARRVADDGNVRSAGWEVV